jgi:23S rRNA pseudouridine1911/1915/1917 synthase
MQYTDLKVLYEDNHLLIVNKPNGVLVQPDKGGNTNMEDIARDYIKYTYKKPGNAFIGIPHRLDRPVSGVLMLCKTSRALRRINEMLRNREIQKTYWAVVEAKPEQEEGLLTHYLRKNESTNLSKAFPTEVKGSSKCQLEYKFLKSSQYYHLLEVNPLTGRHHQIRVQLSTMGCHIKGDVKYGAKRANPDQSIHLHARALSFIHPVKDEPMYVVAEPNLQDKVWAAVMPDRK